MANPPVPISVPMTPLVAPADTSVVGTPAVQALSDAYRNGWITADDIARRTRAEPVEKAQAQAATQQAQEFVMPTAVQARQTALQAESAKNQLITAQAGVQLPEVQAVGAAGPFAGPMIQAYYQYAPLFGIDPTNDGLDIHQKAAAGAHMSTTMARIGYAHTLLKPTTSIKSVNDQGQAVEKQLNAMGADVSQGSPLQQQLQTTIDQGYGQIFGSPGGTTGPVVAPAATPSGQPSVSVQPATDQSAPASTTPSTPAPSVSGVVGAFSNAAPATASAVMQGSPTPVGTYTPIGTVTGPAITPKDMAEEARKRDSVKDWDKSKPFYNSMVGAANRINSFTPEQQRSGKVNLNEPDIALVSNFIKLYDPSAVVREFKWDKIADNQKRTDMIKNVAAVLNKTGAFTPETRQELIKEGVEMYRGKEKAAADSYASVPSNVLMRDEAKLSRDQLTPEYQFPSWYSSANAGAATTAAPQANKVVNIPGLGNVYQGADGKYYRAQ